MSVLDCVQRLIFLINPQTRQKVHLAFILYILNKLRWCGGGGFGDVRRRDAPRPMCLSLRRPRVHGARGPGACVRARPDTGGGSSGGQCSAERRGERYVRVTTAGRAPGRARDARGTDDTRLERFRYSVFVSLLLTGGNDDGRTVFLGIMPWRSCEPLLVSVHLFRLDVFGCLRNVDSLERGCSACWTSGISIFCWHHCCCCWCCCCWLSVVADVECGTL